MRHHLLSRALVLIVFAGLFPAGGRLPTTTPLSEPVRIGDLGTLQKPHMPVSRGAYSWFSRPTQAAQPSAAEYHIGVDDASSTKEFTDVRFKERPRHLTPVGDGSTLVFAVANGDRDTIWRVDEFGTFTLLSGDGIVVHAMLRIDEDRVLVLGAKDGTLNTYILANPFDEYAELKTGLAWSDTYLLTHVLLMADGYACTWKDGANETLRLVDSKQSVDYLLPGPVSSLTSNADGDYLYLIVGANLDLYGTNGLAPAPVKLANTQLKGCKFAACNAGYTIFAARPSAADIVVKVRALVADEMLFATTPNSVLAVAAAESLWTVAGASDPYIHRWNHPKFASVGAMVGSDARLLAEFNSGSVHAEGARTVVLRDAAGTLIEQRVLPAGTIQKLWVGEKAIYIVTAQFGEYSLYRWNQ